MTEPMTVDQMIGLLEAYDCAMPTCGKNVWYPQYTAESVEKFKQALAEYIKEIRLSVVEEIEKEMITHPEDFLFYLIEKEKWQQFKARIKEEK